jgi:hypothetical protein
MVGQQAPSSSSATHLALSWQVSSTGPPQQASVHPFEVGQHAPVNVSAAQAVFAIHWALFTVVVGAVVMVALEALLGDGATGESTGDRGVGVVAPFPNTGPLVGFFDDGDTLLGALVDECAGTAGVGTKLGVVAEL